MSRGYGNRARFERQARRAVAAIGLLNTARAKVGTTRATARFNSYTSPSNVLTASDAGASATITVAGHDRIYPAGTVPGVTVDGGAITGLAFATEYAVYYDDPTLAQTTPTFIATTDIAEAQVGAESGRHFVGVVTTPADGAADESGTGTYPPGGGGKYEIP